MEKPSPINYFFHANFFLLHPEIISQSIRNRVFVLKGMRSGNAREMGLEDVVFVFDLGILFWHAMFFFNCHVRMAIEDTRLLVSTNPSVSVH